MNICRKYLLILLLCGCAGPPAQSNAPPSAAGTLVEVNDTRLFVCVEGAGEPALVIHGGPLLDHGYLAKHLAPLGNELELIFYDQRLSGRSDGVVDSASVRFSTFVQDADALLSAMDRPKAHLIGHSWGGLLAMQYALAHPERVHSLILLDPMAPSSALWQQEEAALGAALTPSDTAGAGELRASAAFAAGDPAAIEAVLRHSFRSQFHAPELASPLDFHIEPDYRERSRQFGYLMPELVGYDLVDRLRTVQIPALIIFGAEEPGLRIGGEVLRNSLSSSTGVSIPEAGHFPFIERPALVDSAIREFLATVAAKP